MRLPSHIGTPRRSSPACDTDHVTKATSQTVVVGVLAALSFLTTACAGGSAPHGVASLNKARTATTSRSNTPAGPGSSASSGPTEAQLLKYAECMRSHGLSDFPDPVPAPGGGYAFKVEPGLNPRSPTPQFKAATTACQKDVPPSLEHLTPAEMAANALKYSQCMRSHGEPDFPEPNSQGLIKITGPSGVMGPSSPEFQRAQKACQSLDNGGFDEEVSK